LQLLQLLQLWVSVSCAQELAAVKSLPSMLLKSSVSALALLRLRPLQSVLMLMLYLATVVLLSPVSCIASSTSPPGSYTQLRSLLLAPLLLPKMSPPGSYTWLRSPLLLSWPRWMSLESPWVSLSLLLLCWLMVSSLLLSWRVLSLAVMVSSLLSLS
jgi:hypothetical protein